MNSIIAYYFSGTGNTKYVIDRLKNKFNDLGYTFDVLCIEDKKAKNIDLMNNYDICFFACPVYGSSIPTLFDDFLKNFKNIQHGKKAVSIVTQYLFSGDTGSYLSNILTGYGFNVISIEHFNMPNNISDISFLKIKNKDKLSTKLNRTEKKMNSFVKSFIDKKYILRGNNFFSKFLGYYLQRKFFLKYQLNLKGEIKIDNTLCNMCTLCTKICPAKNLIACDDIISQNNMCTLCYRCVNSCPKKAISLLSNKKPKVQYHGVNEKSKK